MRKISAVLVMLLVLSAGLTSAQTSKLSDVGTDHWAYEPIKMLLDLKVMSLFDDGSFRPEGLVSRAEFAQIMAKGMQLDIKDVQSSTFLDLSDHWAKNFVEVTKYYLTGFQTSSGFIFKPELPSVREDMAVAMVKAKGMDNKHYKNSTLDAFADKNAISKSLYKYVAIAVEQGLMVGGKGSDGKMYFRPQSNTTRAETASLLSRIISIPEEKVTFSETKVVMPTGPVASSPKGAPVLKAVTQNGAVLLQWTGVTSTNFSYYKVTISAKNTTPKYPQDGSIACLTNVNETSHWLKPGLKFQDGDTTVHLKSGQTYYVTVTAVYKDGNYTSNVVKVVIP